MATLKYIDSVTSFPVSITVIVLMNPVIVNVLLYSRILMLE